VRKVHGSPLPRYDAQIGHAILAWRYEPFVIDGKALPVCKGVHFIYTQR
jgi:hypothetical protein